MITGGKEEVGEKAQGVAGIEEGRCGDSGSTENRAGAARSRGGGGVPVAGMQEGSEEVTRKLPRVDVVLVMSSVRAKRGAERQDDGEAKQRRWTGRRCRAEKKPRGENAGA
jgi:hypothetical protein